MKVISYQLKSFNGFIKFFMQNHSDLSNPECQTTTKNTGEQETVNSISPGNNVEASKITIYSLK